MSEKLQRRALELEAQQAAIREELDDILAALADDEDDSFMFRLATRFQEERDAALRELAALKGKLASEETAWEARFRALESRFQQARSTIARVVDHPLWPRDQVQSELLLVNERIRDYTP